MDVPSMALLAQRRKDVSPLARRICWIYVRPSLSMLLAKQTSIRSAILGRSINTFIGRRCFSIVDDDGSVTDAMGVLSHIYRPLVKRTGFPEYLNSNDSWLWEGSLPDNFAVPGSCRLVLESDMRVSTSLAYQVNRDSHQSGKVTAA